MAGVIDRRSLFKASGALALGASIPTVAGCGSDDETSADSDSAGSGETALRIAWWGGDVRHEKFNAIYDLYEEEHPGVSLSREFADWESYWERLPTQFAGGDAPDVVHVTERQVGDYAGRGALLDLLPLADDGLIDLQYFSQQALDAGTIDEQLVMLLIGATIPATLYNTVMFEQAGIEPPSLDWDWDAFVEKAIELSNELPDDHFGSGYSAVSSPLFETMLIQDGKSLFAPDGSAAINFDAADGERWFTLWKDLLDAGGCLTAELAAEDQSVPFEDTAFARGTIAMYVQNHNQLVTYQAAVGEDELHIAPFPQLGAEPGALVLGSYVSINSGTGNAEECARVIDFFVNNPEANKLFGMELGAPGNTNWQDAIRDELAPEEARVLEFSQAVEDISSIATPRPPGAAQSEVLMPELSHAVAFGELSPAEAGTRLADELTAAVERG